MNYQPGDRMLLIGSSGNYGRVLTLVVTQDQAVDFDFVACADADSNNYAVVTIGSQLWMADNLRTTKFSDGSSIPLVTDTTAWSTLATPGYCWYNNNESTYKIGLGGLYNFLP